MIRTFGRVGAAAALAVGLLLGASPALAAPPDNCPNPAGKYPPGQCKARVSKSQVAPQESFNVTGQGFSRGERVVVDLHSTVARLGSMSANNGGNVNLKTAVPKGTESGTHYISLTGQSSGTILNVDITVLPGSLPRSDTGASGGSDGPFNLPRTGTEIAALAAGSLGVIALGTWFVVAGRRRRATVA